MGKQRLLIDAVSIIDCHKFGCWEAVQNHFAVETVEECFSECGRPSKRPGYVPVNLDNLRPQLAAPPHKVTDIMRVALSLAAPGVQMHPGERDLVSYALTQKPPDFILCGPDNALVRAAVYLKLNNNLISLEEIVTAAGAKNKVTGLDGKNTKRWLSAMKTECTFDCL